MRRGAVGSAFLHASSGGTTPSPAAPANTDVSTTRRRGQAGGDRFPGGKPDHSPISSGHRIFTPEAHPVVWTHPPAMIPADDITPPVPI